MEPLTERRHRIHGGEVPLVMECISNMLAKQLDTKERIYDAIVLYRVLFRFIRHSEGRPPYPEEITWDTIKELVEEAVEKMS